MKRSILGALIAGYAAVSVAAPVISFQALTETKIIISKDQNATVQYQVTNNSAKPHIMVMQPIRGIKEEAKAGSCNTSGAVNEGQSCLLSLRITGRLLEGNVSNAPVVCAEGNANMCYRPQRDQMLAITLVA
jgi:hypothetical protein